MQLFFADSFLASGQRNMPNDSLAYTYVEGLLGRAKQDPIFCARVSHKWSQII